MNTLKLSSGGTLQAPDKVLIEKANQEIAKLVKEIETLKKGNTCTTATNNN